MWKKLNNSSNHFLTFIAKNDYKIYLTDYVKIWYLYFTRADFLTFLKESNSRLNMNENKLIEYGTLLLEYPDCINNVTVDCKDETLALLMSGSNKIRIKPFKLQLKLVEGSKEMFFQKVTQQLIKTIHDLNSSQYELCMLLKEKDEEIEEYKCEGGEIALRHLRTVYFNEEAHMNKHTIYKNIFGTQSIPDSLLTKNVDVPDEHNLLNEEKIKIEYFDVKIEPLSTNTNEECTIPAIKVEPPSPPRTEETELTLPTVNGVKSETTVQSEPTKASTTEIQVIRLEKKSNAQRCKEYRERKKLGDVRVQKKSARKSDECRERDQLIGMKKAKSDAQRSKEYRERQKMKKQIELLQKSTDHLQSTNSTKTPAEYMREYRRKVKLKNQTIQLNALLAKYNSDAKKKKTGDVQQRNQNNSQSDKSDSQSEFQASKLTYNDKMYGTCTHQEETTENHGVKRESPSQELNDQSDGLPTVKQENNVNPTRAMVHNIKRENMASPRKKLRKFCF